MAEVQKKNSKKHKKEKKDVKKEKLLVGNDVASLKGKREKKRKRKPTEEQDVVGVVGNQDDEEELKPKKKAKKNKKSKKEKEQLLVLDVDENDADSLNGKKEKKRKKKSTEEQGAKVVEEKDDKEELQTKKKTKKEKKSKKEKKWTSSSVHLDEDEAAVSSSSVATKEINQSSPIHNSKSYLSSQNLPIVPVSSGNFRHIREDGMIYVDKTKILLENILVRKISGKYHFLARPRRFGKSLLCSTIGEIFLGHGELFKGLYVENKWDFEAEKCPVIHLDMSKLGDDVESMLGSLSDRLATVAETYSLLLDSSRPINIQFQVLIRQLSTQFDRGVVVIIDEYDAPVLDLVDNPEQQKIMQTKLSVFYGLLKAMDSHLRLVFITGIMRFSQMSLFSGLNNIVDMSLYPETSAICGYTELELLHNFRLHLEALASKVECGSTSKVVDTLRSKFNGYCFGIANRETGTLCPTVYNPFAINYVMKDLNFDDEWVASGHAKFLVQRIVDSKNADGLIGEYKLALDDFKGRCTPSSMPIGQLKFCAGYSTISAYNPHNQEVTLSPPNNGVSHDMIEVLLDLAGVPMSLSTFFYTSQRITKTIFAGKAKESELRSLLHAAAMEFLPHHVRLEKEAIFNLLFSNLLQCGCDDKDYKYLGNELSVLTGDIELAMKHLPSNTVCIVEYKLNQSTEVALKQIKEKNFPIRYRDSNVILVGIQASKKSVNVTIEELPIYRE